MRRRVVIEQVEQASTRVGEGQPHGNGLIDLDFNGGSVRDTSWLSRTPRLRNVVIAQKSCTTYPCQR
jgi:hypothetical protein